MPFPLPNYPYTEEQDAFLRENWGKMPARQIGQAIGNRTKNSVIGRAGRLGLPKIQNPATPRQRKEKPVLAKHVKHRVVAKVTLEPLPSLVKEKPMRKQAGPRTLTYYSPDERCQYPTGESPNIRMLCDDPREDGSPYCERHGAVCYRAVEEGTDLAPWVGRKTGNGMGVGFV